MKIRDSPLKEILYLVETTGWVQHKRADYLMRHQDQYQLKVMTVKRFSLLWQIGLLRNRPVMFSSWRTLHNLLKNQSRPFTDAHMRNFLGAVTSHSNIGGGLDPLNPIPGRTPEEAFQLSTDILKRFKTVTVNSLILKELLEPALPKVLYCPNGVDDKFFTPAPKSRGFDPSNIRIGWVGKERGPKNFAVIEAALNQASAKGWIDPRVIKVEKFFKRAPLSMEEMRNFYREIDFYLCASWNEGTPNPGLESASCGVPVISTKVGNMRELIEPGVNGWFVEPTVDSIMQKLSALRSLTPEQYQKMCLSIRSKIEKEWSWESRIGNFLTAFDELTDC